MMVPFLFTMGLCALSHAIELQDMQMTDFVPQEEGVHMEYLSNGIVTYVRENEIPAHHGSFRVVLRKPSSGEMLYTYDGKLDSMETIERFFIYCRDKAVSDLTDSFPLLDDCHFSSSTLPSLQNEGPQGMAIIAVGDFSQSQMVEMIQSHFGSVALTKQDILNENSQSVHIGSDAAISKVVMRISYPNMFKPIHTFEDLRQAWKHLLIQDLYQQRMERCSRSLEEAWVHPHPRFFYPVNGHAFASEEVSENLLSFLLWQIEAIRNDGFYEDEFFMTKRKLLNQLQYLSSKSARPDNAFLASYYVDQFLLGNQCPCYETFLQASTKFVEAMQSNDLHPHIDSFLADKNRSIHMVYPEPRHSELLTKDRIEEIIDRVSSLASFYHDSEIPEEGVLKLKDRSEKVSPAELAKPAALPMQLIHQMDAASFRLADNVAMKVSNSIPSSTEPFYQLLLTDREKQLIKTIVTNMAEKNIFQLAFEKGSIEKKGKKIHHVHPLRFVGYIFANADLKSNMRTIKKSTFKWDAFIDGFAKRMREELENNNVMQYVAGFAQQVGVSSVQVNHYIQKKDWEGLVKSLL